MKIIVTLLFFSLVALSAFCQPRDSTALYVVIKNDGTEFVGKIITEDPREILIDTERLGRVIIPKHEVREIRKLNPGELNQKGEYIPEEVFATRYFFTANGLPIQRGESYIQWNLFGPDVQFGIGKNFGMGVMTSWFGVPIIGTAKYSIRLASNASLGIGALLGTGSWADPQFGIALPFASLTFGNRRSNLTFSGGYGTIFGTGDDIRTSRGLFSIAGMTKAGRHFSVVFDSFIAPNEGALLIPGVRWQMEARKAFQFGFGAVVAGGELLPFPFPMVQWYRKI